MVQEPNNDVVSDVLSPPPALHPWGNGRPYNSYAAYFSRLFGGRVQKVAINAGFSCPNRDGTLSTGGCSFCNNEAFTPSYCLAAKSIRQQIDEGIEFHRRRYRSAKFYLAYFQSFSNTHAPIDRLREVYDQALMHPQVGGIVVGTRPDCVDAEKLDYFAELGRKKYVALEYGIESCDDLVLRHVNRGHDFECARRAVEATANRGIHCCGHFILGLLGQSRQAMISQTATINSLPLTSIKFHQLQIFKNTPMADEWHAHPERFDFPSPEEYIDLFIEILIRLRPDMVVERFAGEAPPRFHEAGQWGLLRNEQLVTMLVERLESRGLYQGIACEKRQD